MNKVIIIAITECTFFKLELVVVSFKFLNMFKSTNTIYDETVYIYIPYLYDGLILQI